jgi:hypothetical protein
MKYGNDLELTGLVSLLTDRLADVNACVRNGHLDTAFQHSLRLDDINERLQERLNRLKYP